MSGVLLGLYVRRGRFPEALVIVRAVRRNLTSGLLIGGVAVAAVAVARTTTASHTPHVLE